MFIADADRGDIGLGVIMTTAAFVLVATAFLYLYKIEAAFQLGLLVFVIANFLALRMLKKRSARAIARSRAIMVADRDMFGLEKLRVVEHYLLGAWQTRRFCAMMAMAALQLAVALLWRFTAAAHLLDGLSIRQVEGGRLAPFVPAILFAAFVAISETWIMKHRNDTLAALKSLESLSMCYTLKSRRGTKAEADREDWILYPLTE